MRPYGPAMVALEHHIRTAKHWEKEMERTEGYFKEKIALEKQVSHRLSPLSIVRTAR
jgi:hypothetical protein